MCLFCLCCKRSTASIAGSVSVLTPQTIEYSTENSPSAWALSPKTPTSHGYFLVKTGTTTSFVEKTAYWNGSFWIERHPGSPERALEDVLAFLESGTVVTIVKPGEGLYAVIERDETSSKVAVAASRVLKS